MKPKKSSWSNLHHYIRGTKLRTTLTKEPGWKRAGKYPYRRHYQTSRSFTYIKLHISLTIMATMWLKQDIRLMILVLLRIPRYIQMKCALNSLKKSINLGNSPLKRATNWIKLWLSSLKRSHLKTNSIWKPRWTFSRTNALVHT